MNARPQAWLLQACNDLALAWLGLNPVRQGQACDALELPLVVGHHSGSLCQGMAGNPKVVGADGCARPFQGRCLLCIVLADLWALGKQHRNLHG